MSSSATNSPAARVEVEALARIKVEEIGDDDTKVDVFYEHGQWWVKLWNLPPSVGAYDDEIVYGVVDLAVGIGLEDL